MAKLTRIRGAFGWCSLLLVAVLVVPRVGGSSRLWLNALHDLLNIILVFPLIIYLAASGSIEGRFSGRLCKFLGEISYPVYITHYPLIYTYTAWVADHKPTPQAALPFGLLVFFGSITLAYASLKLYDEPVRRWLHRKVPGEPATITARG